MGLTHTLVRPFLTRCCLVVDFDADFVDPQPVAGSCDCQACIVAGDWLVAVDEAVRDHLMASVVLLHVVRRSTYDLDRGNTLLADLVVMWRDVNGRFGTHRGTVRVSPRPGSGPKIHLFWGHYGADGHREAVRDYDERVGGLGGSWPEYASVSWDGVTVSSPVGLER